MYKPGVIKRRITGIALGVMFIALWLLQGWIMRIVLTVLGLIAVGEVYAALEHRGARPVKWVGLAYMVLCLPVCHFCGGFTGLFFLTALMAAIGMCAVMLRGDIESDALLATLFPLFYPGMLFAVLLIPTYIQPELYATLVIGLTYLAAILNDVAAYEIGTLYGKRLLAPRLSPKKTIEGSAAGMAASVAVSAIMPVALSLACKCIVPLQGYACDLPSWWVCAIYGVIAGVAAQYGDLCASMVKRYCGVKDYGTIFPGHGGVMDRMDSILFNGLCATIFFVLVMR